MDKHYTRYVKVLSVETLGPRDVYTHVVCWEHSGLEEVWYTDAKDELDAYKRFIDHAENQKPYWKVVRDDDG